MCELDIEGLPAVEVIFEGDAHALTHTDRQMYIPDCSNGRVGACIRLLWNYHLYIQPVLDVLHGEPSLANDQAHLVVRHEHMQRGGGGVVQLLHLRGVHSFFAVCADRLRSHLIQMRSHHSTFQYLKEIESHYMKLSKNN